MDQTVKVLTGTESFSTGDNQIVSGVEGVEFNDNRTDQSIGKSNILEMDETNISKDTIGIESIVRPSGNKVVTILCGAESVKFKVSLADFNFGDFDSWVRSRFCIQRNEKIFYKDDGGCECLPTKCLFLDNSEITIERSKLEGSLIDSSSQLMSPTDQSIGTRTSAFTTRPATQFNNTNDEDHYSFLIVIVLLTAIWMYSQGIVSVDSLVAALDKVENRLIEWGVFNRKGVALESFLSCICWAVPYLFIRRLCNPETSKGALTKYSADAVFGGLAAAGTVVLKSMLFTSLMKHH